MTDRVYYRREIAASVHEVAERSKTDLHTAFTIVHAAAKKARLLDKAKLSRLINVAWKQIKPYLEKEE